VAYQIGLLPYSMTSIDIQGYFTSCNKKTIKMRLLPLPLTRDLFAIAKFLVNIIVNITLNVKVSMTVNSNVTSCLIARCITTVYSLTPTVAQRTH